MKKIKPKTRKKRQYTEDRRLGKDGERVGQDINIYRWFALFLKITKELEDKKVKFDLLGKRYPIKINTSHHWYKKINVKTLPKSPKFLRFDIKNFYRDTRAFFDGYFWQKYRPLFLEPKSKILTNLNNVDKEKYDVVAVALPKSFSQRQKISDIRLILKQQDIDKLKYRKGRRKLGTSRHKAEIPIEGAKDNVLKRLFHIFRLSQTKKNNFTILDVYSHYMNQIYKQPLIKIVRKTKHSGSAKTMKDYESQIRNTMRDIRFTKFLILNLCKGKFPVMKKLEK